MRMNRYPQYYLSLLSYGALITITYSFSTISIKNIHHHHHHHHHHHPTTTTATILKLNNNENNNNNNNEGSLDKGFNILGKANALIPQGTIVTTAKAGWKFIWNKMMVELAPQDKSGSYTRPTYAFKNKIGDNNFPDEAGRYHLYVGNPCPWCHRTLLSIKLRNITPDEISITHLLSNAEKATRGGWIFNPSTQRNKDPLYNSYDLYTLYNKIQPTYDGRCTAPLLVDKISKKIVSNESSDIIRMLNTCTFGKNQRMDLYPAILQ